MLEDQSALDQKVLTLWRLYADNHEVSTSLRDVESMRANATNIGIVATVAAFGLNEVARLILRSRKLLVLAELINRECPRDV